MIKFFRFASTKRVKTSEEIISYLSNLLPPCLICSFHRYNWSLRSTNRKFFCTASMLFFFVTPENSIFHYFILSCFCTHTQKPTALPVFDSFPLLIQRNIIFRIFSNFFYGKSVIHCYFFCMRNLTFFFWRKIFIEIKRTFRFYRKL